MNTSRARRHPRGKVNPVTVVLLAGLTTAGWYGFHVAPLYLDNLDVREQVDTAINVAVAEGAERGRDQATRKLNGTVGWHYAEDPESGAELQAPGLGLEPDQLVVEIQPHAIHAHLEYDRVVQLKPLKKRKVFHFVHDKTVAVQ